MLSVVIASTWMNMGGAILIYLAALQNIPGELYEAAELDGAGHLAADPARDDPADPADPVADALLQIVATMQVFIEPLILRQRRRRGGLHDLGGLPDLPARRSSRTTSTAPRRSA